MTNAKETSSAHTAGTWRTQTTDDNRLVVYSVDAGVPLCLLPRNDGIHAAEHSANARLIAAAPDLLEACENVCEMIERHQDLIPVDAKVANDGYAMLKSATDKAYGKKS